MIDARQEKWLRDKLSWIFGFVQLEANPFGDFHHWYRGTPVGANALVYPNKEYRTVFMDEYTEPPTEIDGWAFDRTFAGTTQECDCPGKGIRNGGLVVPGQTVKVPTYPTGTYEVCPYCEKRQGERHGKIKLDSKWHEVVYSRDSNV